MNFNIVVDTDRYATENASFVESCRKKLEEDGVLVLPGFMRPAALHVVRDEAESARDKAYYCTQKHSVYLTEHDDRLPADHIKNRLVESSKGCICDDEVSESSPLRVLYNAAQFRRFIMGVTGETELHPYADTLSSINVHYAHRGQELGWHFDNSKFAISLMIEKADAGAQFEYVKDVRDAENDAMTYDAVEAVLDGQTQARVLEMDPGTFVLFRGQNSLHRVTANEGDKTRILAVLAYNSKPDIALPESARMTFYGRLS